MRLELELLSIDVAVAGRSVVMPLGVVKLENVRLIDNVDGGSGSAPIEEVGGKGGRSVGSVGVGLINVESVGTESVGVESVGVESVGVESVNVESDGIVSDGVGSGPGGHGNGGGVESVEGGLDPLGAVGHEKDGPGGNVEEGSGFGLSVCIGPPGLSGRPVFSVSDVVVPPLVGSVASEVVMAEVVELGNGSPPGGGTSAVDEGVGKGGQDCGGGKGCVMGGNGEGTDEEVTTGGGLLSEVAGGGRASEEVVSGGGSPAGEEIVVAVEEDDEDGSTG